MRVFLLIAVLLLSLFGGACRAPNASSTERISGSGIGKPAALATVKVAEPAAASAAKIDFDKQIKPIFQTRCQPCHFQGGSMYQRLPFDQPKTIVTLGTKLFTRIKDEQEQQLIRQFLAQQ